VKIIADVNIAPRTVEHLRSLGRIRRRSLPIS